MLIWLKFNLIGSTFRYDQVLRDGMPDWRSAVYYYRRYRKMGLGEMIALVFVIFTIGQYIVAWAVYAEKKFTAVSCNKWHFAMYIVRRPLKISEMFCSFQESLFGSKIRKLHKKNKTTVNIDEILNQIPTPSVKDTLPFQIVRGIWNTPGAIKNVFSGINEYKDQIREEKRR